jgi:hypothetical protein
MRLRGIAYETGFVVRGATSRPDFDPEVVRRELAIIRDDLHCNAVQLIGGDPHRLEVAGGLAAELGLEVWFSPYPLELTPPELRSLLVECAERAEALRRGGAEVVFVAGVELSVMCRGFLAGDSTEARLADLLGRPDLRRERIAEVRRRLDDFLGGALAEIRGRFGGPVTYASIPYEGIDWAPFDLVTVELIRSAEVADRFREGVRSLVAGGKPVAITGFGTATYRGAGDRGGRTMDIVEYDAGSGAPRRLSGLYERDEQGQAAYLRELLEIFQSEGVDAAFVYLFALSSFPHRPGGPPEADLDLASPGIVKVLEAPGTTYAGLAWEPKAAFRAVAEFYARPN